MIKTVIFDLGGVVLSRGLWLFRKYLVENFGVTDNETISVMIKKYYKPFFSGKMNEEEYWKKCLGELNVKHDWKELRKILLGFYEPQRDLLELVTLLRKRGYVTGLLSDQTKEWWSELNSKYALEQHFDFCIISAEAGFSKPDERIYELVLDKSGSSSGKCVFIDDLEQNLEPARKLGMKTILFRSAKQLKEELVSLGVSL